jgi:hypothetical protein
MSLSFTLRRKRSDYFQGIDIDLLNHGRSFHRRSLGPAKDDTVAGKCRFD